VELVVARGFIGNIAGKTLQRVKELAEAEYESHVAGRGGRPYTQDNQ
jgi:hypothetical protein